MRTAIRTGRRRSRERARPKPAVVVSPLPPPDTVFLDWLMSLSPAADASAAALEQIALIDSRSSLHPDVRCLRILLVALAGAAPWPRPIAAF